MLVTGNLLKVIDCERRETPPPPPPPPPPPSPPPPVGADVVGVTTATVVELGIVETAGALPRLGNEMSDACELVIQT